MQRCLTGGEGARRPRQRPRKSDGCLEGAVSPPGGCGDGAGCGGWEGGIIV